MKRIFILLFTAAAFMFAVRAEWADKFEKNSLVTIPAGEHQLSRTVEINHDLTIIFENGAVLKSASDPMF